MRSTHLGVPLALCVLFGCGLQQQLKDRLSSQKKGDGDTGDHATQPAQPPTGTASANATAVSVSPASGTTVSGTATVGTGSVVVSPKATPMAPGPAPAPASQDPAQIKDSATLAQFLDNVANAKSNPVPISYDLRVFVCPQKSCFENDVKANTLQLAERAIGGHLESLDQLNALGTTDLDAQGHFSTTYGTGMTQGLFDQGVLSSLLGDDALKARFGGVSSYSYQTDALDLAKLASADELFTDARRVTGKAAPVGGANDFGFAFALRDKDFTSYAKGVASTLEDVSKTMKLDLGDGYDAEKCANRKAELIGDVQVTLDIHLADRRFIFLSEQVEGCGFVFAPADLVQTLKDKLDAKVKDLKPLDLPLQ